MFVYQGLFLHTVTAILEMIIARSLCHTSEAYTSAYTLSEKLGIIFTFFALGALLRIYSRFSAEYQKRSLFRTFWVFKGIVLLYMIESLVIRIIVPAGAVDPTRYMSQADFLGRAEFYGVLPVLRLLVRVPQVLLRMAVPARRAGLRGGAECGWTSGGVHEGDVAAGCSVPTRAVYGVC